MSEKVVLNNKNSYILKENNYPKENVVREENNYKRRQELENDKDSKSHVTV